MTFSQGAAAAVILAGCVLAGCAQTRTIQTKAVAPTTEEAREMARGQLQQQIADMSGGDYKPAGSPHFTTRLMTQPDGGTLYEVTGTEKAVKTK